MARPTLPRIRRGRARGEAGQIVERTEPRIAELSANGLTWIHINEPGPLEAAYLAERFGFHELDIEDVLSKRQRPKIDEYPEYLFIVLHFPIYDKAVQRLNAAELDVFLGQDFLITLAERRASARHLSLPPLRGGRRAARRALLEGARDTCSTTSSTTSSTTASRSWTRSGTSSTRSRTSSSERPQRGDRPRHLRREAGDHRVPQDHQARARDLRLLERHTQRFLPAGPRALLRRHRRRAERIWDLLDNYKEVVEALEDTNESIISHRQQYRLQLLTVVSVILLPLTLIASIFGMNIARPRARAAPKRFWVVVGVDGGARDRAPRRLPLAPLAVIQG